MKQVLIDTFNITPQIVEDAVNKGRMVVEGIFQKAGVKNANGRVYPRSLWERILNNENVKKTLSERRCLGEVDHPNDGKTLLTRASHLVLDQKLQENGDIIGRAEILDTPNGKILQELLRSGVTVGISSRGSGSVKKNNLGEDVVQDDFVFDTYDWVLSPSTIGAYPKVVTEDIEENKIEENSMTGKEKFNFLEARASKVLGTKPSKDPSLCEVVSEAASDMIVELTKVGGETPELKELTQDLISQLSAKRKEIRETWTQGTADTGIRRETPMEAKPPAGEGWPVNPNDAGPLNGINAGKEEFMKTTGGGIGAGKGPVTEDEEDKEEKAVEEEDKKVEEGENPFEKKDDDDDDDEDEKKKKKEEGTDRVILAAQYLVESVETPENRVARAFAAAYLLERDNRIASTEAFSKTATKMQEKFQEAVESGKIIVETVNDEKYQVALGVIEELTKRHKLLSAKVYAESQLDKVGLKSNADARKTVAEAIKTDPTKKSIDEAIAAMVNVTGFKPKKEENKITESTELPISNYMEGKIAKLNESTPKSFSDGPALAKRLSDGLSFSRSTK